MCSRGQRRGRYRAYAFLRKAGLHPAPHASGVACVAYVGTPARYTATPTPTVHVLRKTHERDAHHTHVSARRTDGARAGGAYYDTRRQCELGAAAREP